MRDNPAAMQIKSMFFRAGVLLILCFGLFGAGGCAEATLATAGAFVGMAAAGISTGADVYRMGKLDSVDLCEFDDLKPAVYTAAKQLNLTVVSETMMGYEQCKIKLIDDRGTTMRVSIQSNTKRLCATRIDVGIFGSEPTARLLLARVRYAAGVRELSFEEKAKPTTMK